MIHRQKYHFQALYFFIFFGQGALIPYLTLYFSNDAFRLSASEIGTIVAVGPVLSIVLQPVWGMAADRFGRPKRLLLVALLAAGLLTVSYLLTSVYLLLLLIASLWALFQCAHIPLVDTLAIEFSKRKSVDYGALRLFGSAGFALAVFILGQVTEQGSLGAIFYASGAALVLGFLVLIGIEETPVGSVEREHVPLATLFSNKRFLLFLAGGSLVFGPIFANNYYFGSYVTIRGESTALVGTLFFVAVLCEIPFMRVATRVMLRFGPIPVLVFVSLLSAMRTGLLALEPPVWTLWILAALQGLIVGLLIPVALDYVRSLVPASTVATAVSTYMATTTGLATALFNLMSGFVFDQGTIYTVFWVYTGSSLFGACLYLISGKIKE
ncbi:MFS transporter [Exiguobacterium antarcticum]|uniref:MFS transporter n=1 Tax=Exiguobacterium antarcticum TaxID=132920 RepID=A0ABT6QXT2_9BACL|nr:MFS transporter [Exiguobacterium antarcticum]AFS71216.1 Major facilitator superfamily MFS_1 [Exiguobacterium antarcticum B7]MDI3233428.1 MFS transporter [Exiguobacterium antarcticum]